GRDFLFAGAGNDVLFAGQRLNPPPGTDWLQQYESLLAQETRLTAEIRALEERRRAGGLTQEEQAQLQALSNPRAAVNLAEIDLDPFQEVLVDLLDGGDGNDRLTGSEVQDMIVGGAGNDTIVYSDGVDTVIGGDGIDTYLYEGTEGADNIAV